MPVVPIKPSELHSKISQNVSNYLTQLGNQELYQQCYSDLELFFREDIDLQYNISRTVVSDADSKSYPTGRVVLRNAVNAYEIDDDRINHFRVEKSNVMLRVLGRLRGIDYVLGQKLNDPAISKKEKEEYQKTRHRLFTDFSRFVAEIRQEDITLQEQIDIKEKDFNTTLCDVLHDAHLDEGCESAKDYEKLLFHYRNLAALIDPAASLVTVSYDTQNHVIHRITQHPIAEKTAAQKRMIKEEMETVALFPLGTEKNFQTKQNMAMQVANQHFAALAARDDRMLGAQARKTHLHGIKNGFLVKNELLFDEKLDETILFTKQAKADDSQIFVRSATPVYVGSGESDTRVQESVRENMRQVRQFVRAHTNVADPKMHYTCLVTDSPLENQHAMYHQAKRATEQKDSNYDIAYAPTNYDGTHRRMVLATNPDMQLDAKDQPSLHPVMQGVGKARQAYRYEQVANLSYGIRNKTGENVVEHVGCASGQDRTETVAEKSTQLWIRERYKKNGKNLVADANKGDAVEATRAKSRNSAEINAHVVGGSRGAKHDSRGKGLYAPLTDQAMYLESASTNKKNVVNKEIVKSYVVAQSGAVNVQLDSALAALRAAYEAAPEGSKLKETGQSIHNNATQLKDRIKQQDKSILIRAINQAAIVIRGPQGGDRTKEKYAKEVERLGQIAHGLKTKRKYSYLKLFGASLLALAGVALVAAGILFAIPTGGISLLSVVLGAKAIAVSTATIGLGIATAGVSAVATGRHTHTMWRTPTPLERQNSFIKAISHVHQKAKKEDVPPNAVTPSKEEAQPLLSDKKS